MVNKMVRSSENRKEDGNFKKKNIKHGQGESVRAAFNKPGIEELDKEE